MSAPASRAAIGDSDAVRLRSHGQACRLLGMAADDGIICSDLYVITNCRNLLRSCWLPAWLGRGKYRFR